MNPKRNLIAAGVQYEYTYYLMYAHAGDEFRSNSGSQSTFFDEEGILRQDMAEMLHEDISILLATGQGPSLGSEQSVQTDCGRAELYQRALFAGGDKENVFEKLTPEDLETKVRMHSFWTAHPGKTDAIPVLTCPANRQRWKSNHDRRQRHVWSEWRTLPNRRVRSHR
jgi:hypothetical protein